MNKYFVGVVLILFLLLSGCSNNAVTQPEVDDNEGEEVNISIEEPEVIIEDKALFLIGNEFGNTYFEMKMALESQHFSVTTVGVGSFDLMSSCPNHENVKVTPDLNIKDLTEEMLKEFEVVFIPSGKHHRNIPYDRDVKRVLEFSKEHQIFVSSVCAGNLVLTEINGLVDGYDIASSSVTGAAIRAAGGTIVYQDVVEDGIFITGDQGGGQSGNGFEGAPIEALAETIRKSVDNKPEFSEVNTVIDYDGNSYKTMTFGEQIWMVENLRVTHTNTGEDIVYYKSDDMTEEDGLLYDSKMMNDDLAPEGWRIPTAEDYTILLSVIGNGEEGVYTLIEGQGFNFQTVGMYDFTGKYQWYDYRGVLGTRTRNGNGLSHYFFDGTTIEKGNFHPDDGVSVRCIKIVE